MEASGENLARAGILDTRKLNIAESKAAWRDRGFVIRAGEMLTLSTLSTLPEMEVTSISLALRLVF